MAADPLDRITDRIRSRIHDRKRPEDRLIATFHEVERLSVEEAQAILQQLVGRCLVLPDSVLAQMLIAKLGLTEQFVWRHLELAGDGQWQEGRGDDHNG